MSDLARRDLDGVMGRAFAALIWHIIMASVMANLTDLRAFDMVVCLQQDVSLKAR